MSGDVWIGALISIPIGVGTGIVAPLIQHWYQTQSTWRAEKRSAMRRTEYWRTLLYVARPELFTQYLIMGTIRGLRQMFVFFTSLIPVLVVLLGTKGEQHLSRWDKGNSIFFIIVGMLLNSISLWSAMNIWIEIRDRWDKVRGFQQYVETVPYETRNPTAENEFLRRNLSEVAFDEWLAE